MKLMVLILNKTDALDNLLEGMSAAGLGGATILSGSEEDNRTILSVIRNDQLDIARKVIYNTVGDLSSPNTGILFTVPIDFVEGTRKNRRRFEDMLPQEQQEEQPQTAKPPVEEAPQKQKKRRFFGKRGKEKEDEQES